VAANYGEKNIALIDSLGQLLGKVPTRGDTVDVKENARASESAFKLVIKAAGSCLVAAASVIDEDGFFYHPSRARRGQNIA
jgi:hypothetical protein